MLAPCEDSWEVDDTCVIALGTDDDWVAGDNAAVAGCKLFHTLEVDFRLGTIVVKTSDGASTPPIAVVSSIPVGSIFSESVGVELTASDADWRTGDIGAVAPCSSVGTLIEIVFDVPRWSGEPS